MRFPGSLFCRSALLKGAIPIEGKLLWGAWGCAAAFRTRELSR